MPLIHRPGEAQVDFGFALTKVSGALRQLLFFVMALTYSEAFFVVVFERKCAETYCEGHVRAFAFSAGVLRRLSFNGSKALMSRILGAYDLKLTNRFLQLKNHYFFDHHFRRICRANEKGWLKG